MSARHFLGWDAPALPRAAELLLAEFGDELHEVMVALPGRRAGRRLEELLVERAPAAWRPPRIEAIGPATDRLVRFPAPRAGDLTRELAWIAALRGLDPESLQRLVARPPDAEDAGAWLALADTVRALHAELAGEGLRFADVAARGAGRDAFPRGTQERARWEALAAVQEAYARTLEEHGLCDPHLGRLQALDEGAVDATAAGARHVVLLGVAELNALQEKALAAAEDAGVSVRAWVIAPADHADRFDDFGALRPDAWSREHFALRDEDWAVVGTPQDQAEDAVGFLAEHADDRPADDVAACVLDEDVAPALQRALAEHGSGLRPPTGPPLSETPPWRLLEGLADFLEERDAASLAALCRHTDLSAALLDGEDDAAALAGELDDHRAERLPWRLESARALRDARRPRLTAAWKRLEELCTPALWPGGPATLEGCAGAARAVLEDVYGARVFRRDRESDRVCVAALERLVEAISGVERLPPALAAERVAPADGLRLLLRATRAAAVPPPARHAREIERLGWLDLPFEDAPVALVLGFQHGVVPAALHAHAFLPDALRRALGIPDQEAREARDLYHARVVVETRRGTGGAVRFLAGRRSAAGDPLVPSGLLFRCRDEELAARARAAFPEDVEPRPRPREEVAVTPYEAPVHGLWRAPEHWSASSINQFLRCPYAFFLERVVQVQEPSEDKDEMNALVFGGLVHAVLEDFGRDEEARASRDPEEVAAFLRARLHEVAGRRLSTSLPAAVALQLDHAERRLQRFAEVHVADASRGWRIQEVEWEPPDGVQEVTIGGQSFALRGKVDRIDRNEDTGAWRVLDYKSGERAIGMDKVWKKRAGEWLDLQLPLYRHLVRAFPGMRGELRLGYFSLPRALDDTGIWPDPDAAIASPFTEKELEEADARIAEVVRTVREAVEARDPAPFREEGTLPREGLVPVLAGKAYLLGADDGAEDGGDGAEVPA